MAGTNIADSDLDVDGKDQQLNGDVGVDGKGRDRR